jgi:hypothetical protein
VRSAKETLSSSATAPVFVPPPVNRELQTTRESFSDLIAPAVERTLDVLADTFRRADVEAGELAAIYLVGGSSRIPLVASLVRERFGRADFLGDPKLAVALGAARARLARPGRRAGQPAAPPPRPPARRRGAAVLAALLALLFAGGVAALAATGSFPWHSASTTTPTTTPLDQLKRHIPADIRASCSPIFAEGSSSEPPAGTRAAAKCTPPDVASEVRYYWYFAKPAMHDAYQAGSARARTPARPRTEPRRTSPT